MENYQFEFHLLKVYLNNHSGKVNMSIGHNRSVVNAGTDSYSQMKQQLLDLPNYNLSFSLGMLAV